MGPKGSKVQSITEEFGVQIKFPECVDPEVIRRIAMDPVYSGLLKIILKKKSCKVNLQFT